MPVSSLSLSLLKPFPDVAMIPASMAADGSRPSATTLSGCAPAGVVGVHVEHERRVEPDRAVEPVALILHEDQMRLVEERDVVEARVILVGLIEQPQRAPVALRVLPQLLNRAEATVGGSGLGREVRVAGLGEEELLEVRAWLELAVLGPLERRA